LLHPTIECIVADPFYIIKLWTRIYKVDRYWLCWTTMLTSYFYMF